MNAKQTENRSKSGRKRRIKGSKKVSQADSAEDNDVEVDDSRAEPSASTMSSAVLDFTEVGVKESKLPPLAGTTAEKMAKYGEKSKSLSLYSCFICCLQ